MIGFGVELRSEADCEYPLDTNADLKYPPDMKKRKNEVCK